MQAPDDLQRQIIDQYNSSLLKEAFLPSHTIQKEYPPFQPASSNSHFLAALAYFGSLYIVNLYVEIDSFPMMFLFDKQREYHLSPRYLGRKKWREVR